MKLKYSIELQSLPNCPPPSFQQRDSIAFRFVHGDISDPRNFMAPAKLKPNRLFDSDHNRCRALALSMFETREQAVAFYRSLATKYKNIRNTLGTHLASGTVTHDDGLASSVRRDGHFDFFAAEEAALESKFIISEAL